LSGTRHHYPDESEHTNAIEYILNPKCVNCGKEFDCVIYDGGQREYGVYLICKGCDKLRFDWEYEGY